jgi:hypothetical protein
MQIGKLMRAMADPFVGPEDTDAKALEQAVTPTTASMAAKVPGILGGGTEAWNGKVHVFRAASSPSIAAEMEWDGRMNMNDTTAAGLKDAMDHPDQPVKDPTAFEVTLHELIHGNIGGSPADLASYDAALGIRDPGNPPKYSDNKLAYQDPVKASIEEGFSELGAIHHAHEMFDAMGVGSHLTQVKSDYGDRAATMDEVADKLADPERIDEGGAKTWGHYGWQTRMAQQWVQQIATDEGHTDLKPGQPGYQRVRELADEINRQGTANKMRAMAMQVVLAGLKNTPEAPLLKDKDALLAVIHNTKKAIRDSWAGDEAALNSHSAALQGARVAAHNVAMARPAAERTAAA